MTTPAGPRSAPSSWLRVRSAVIDRILAMALAPLVGPVVAALAWRVARVDGGPAFVALERVGRHGRVFRMWKLRTMRARHDDGSAGGAVITSTADARITAFGRTLRRWRLDELPQLLNVLAGDMALLGPRPETPVLVDRDDPRWRAVLTVRPGVAGSTQLLVEEWEASVLDGAAHEARYRDEILPVKLAADRWYVEHASPLVDLRLAWSMIERFLLGRRHTNVERIVRARVPEAATVPFGHAA